MTQVFPEIELSYYIHIISAIGIAARSEMPKRTKKTNTMKNAPPLGVAPSGRMTYDVAQDPADGGLITVLDLCMHNVNLDYFYERIERDTNNWDQVLRDTFESKSINATWNELDWASF